MPKTKAQKMAIAEGLSDRLRRMSGAVIADFGGLKMEEFDALRAKGRAEQCEYMVVKKTLFTRALQDAGMAFDASSMAAGVSVLLGFADPVAPAKLAKTFAKDHPALRVLGGFLREDAAVRVLTTQETVALGSLPSREVLIARAVGSIAAPLRGMLGVLQGNTRNLVGVLQAIAQAKAGAASAS
ncbi:50S ribosomal protein L10 [Candidatus Uhrbacteria bacterium]|nr:50S ribosomal protein L10 [Candidatus Uhrbacteria bacterium]